MSDTSGFTLLEIMIVVAIIGFLAAIAIPAWVRARETSFITTYEADLRVSSQAFQQYPFGNNGTWPPEAAAGIIPTGMGPYLSNMDWTRTTSIGGQWDWDGATHRLCTVGTTCPDSWLQRIDKEIDDNNLTTGSFIETAPGDVAFIVDN